MNQWVGVTFGELVATFVFVLFGQCASNETSMIAAQFQYGIGLTLALLIYPGALNPAIAIAQYLFYYAAYQQDDSRYTMAQTWWMFLTQIVFEIIGAVLAVGTHKLLFGR